MNTSIQPSRFALLKVEGSDDEEKRRVVKSANAGQKKKKKKKDGEKSNDKNDLRSLAFGIGKPVPKKKSGDKKSTVTTQQFQEWKEHDQDFVDEMFAQELEQAILVSKLEHEEKKQTSNSSSTNRLETEAGLTKKAKSKQKPMSMAEFQQLDSSDNTSANKHGSDKEKQKIPPGSGDNFFEDVANSASNLKRQDKLKEEYAKQYKVQAVMQAKYNAEAEEKDKLIQYLKGQVEELQNELTEVKKRNSQLCFILGQGEMKDKASILQQVDQLITVKDELTTQISSLTSDLEKEKSKVHSLQNELTKLKGKTK